MSDDDTPPIMQTLANVTDHLDEDDRQPTSIMVTEGHVTMTLASIDDLLSWHDVIAPSTRVTLVAERLWKQGDESPTVITLDYVWNDQDFPPCRYRLCASSALTMEPLKRADVDARVEVTHSQVVDLMLADKTRDLSM